MSIKLEQSTMSLGTASRSRTAVAGQRQGARDTRADGVTGWHARSPPDTSDSRQKPIDPAVYQKSQSQAGHDPIILQIPFYYVGRGPFCRNL